MVETPKKGKQGKKLIFGFTVTRDAQSNGPDLGKDHEDDRILGLSIKNLKDKFGDKAYAESFLFRNGDFTSDPEFRERSLPLPPLEANQSELFEIPIGEAKKQTITNFLSTPEQSPEANEQLSVYLLANYFQDDRRLSKAFSVIGLARLLCDVGILRGEPHKNLQLNLQACGILEFHKGEEFQKFLTAVKAFSGNISKEQADQIENFLKEGKKVPNELTAPLPKDFKLEVRAPRYLVWTQPFGSKIYYRRGTPLNQIRLYSEMTPKEKREYKSSFQLQANGKWVETKGRNLGVSDSLEERVSERVSQQWGSQKKDIKFTNKLAKDVWKKPPLHGEVVGRDENFCYVIKLDARQTKGASNEGAEDKAIELAMPKTSSTTVKVAKIPILAFGEGGGIGQQFHIKSYQDITLLNGAVSPQTIEAAPQKAQSSLASEQELANAVGIPNDKLLNVVDLQNKDDRELVLATAESVKRSFPHISKYKPEGKVLFELSHIDNANVYLLQRFPPTFPESRVVKVQRDMHPKIFGAERSARTDVGPLGKKQIFELDVQDMGREQKIQFTDFEHYKKLESGGHGQFLISDRRQEYLTTAIAAREKWLADNKVTREAVEALGNWSDRLKMLYPEDAIQRKSTPQGMEEEDESLNFDFDDFEGQTEELSELAAVIVQAERDLKAPGLSEIEAEVLRADIVNKKNELYELTEAEGLEREFADNLLSEHAANFPLDNATSLEVLSQKGINPDVPINSDSEAIKGNTPLKSANDETIPLEDPVKTTGPSEQPPENVKDLQAKLSEGYASFREQVKDRLASQEVSQSNQYLLKPLESPLLKMDGITAEQRVGIEKELRKIEMELVREAARKNTRLTVALTDVERASKEKAREHWLRAQLEGVAVSRDKGYQPNAPDYAALETKLIEKFKGMSIAEIKANFPVKVVDGNSSPEQVGGATQMKADPQTGKTLLMVDHKSRAPKFVEVPTAVLKAALVKNKAASTELEPGAEIPRGIMVGKVGSNSQSNSVGKRN